MVIACGVIGCMLFGYLQQPRFIRMLDHKLYDAMLAHYGSRDVSPLPVIVDLDDASLKEYGQWPWPRFVLAGLLERLAQQGARAVGVDVLLIEPDRTSPDRVRADLHRFLDLDVTVTGLPDMLRDYDALLAEVMRRLPVVLGMYGDFAPGAAPPPYVPRSVGTVVQKRPDAAPYPHAPLVAGSLLPPLEIFADTPVGLLNMSPDEDGVVRRIPLLVQHGDAVYPSLALRTLMLALGQTTLAQRVGPDGLEALRVGQYTVPVSPDGSLTIPYAGKARTYPYYTAMQVLKGDVPPEALNGRIVFLGTSAPGLLDIRITPLDRVYPGVEVHATVLDSIVQQHFLTVPPYAPGLQVLGIVLCGLAAALAFGFARARIYIPAGAALAGAVAYASISLFRDGTVLSPLYAVCTIVLMGGTLLLMRFWLEERQKSVLRSAFSRYVAPEVVDRISKLKGDVFAGEAVELSIMFTDIRGFTSISERLSPEQVVELLNRYFTPMTALVRGNRGTLDKFIGDALMAFWNAPVPVQDHPVLAVETARAMQAGVEAINPGLEAEFGVRLAIGVGLHTGTAYVGNMGSEELLNYTLIGDNVNLASRLEGLCPRYGVGIVVSGETAGRCAARFVFQRLDRLRVKGKQQPVDIFTPLSPEEGAMRQEELERHEVALAAYGDGRFDEAHELFVQLWRTCGEARLYALYAERCAELAASPPDDWDGVWTMTSK